MFGESFVFLRPVLLDLLDHSLPADRNSLEGEVTALFKLMHRSSRPNDGNLPRT
jgi:hypothetical protein